MLNDVDKYLTVAELAGILKVGKNKAYELLHSRKIPYFQIGKLYRVDKDDLENFILNSKGIIS